MRLSGKTALITGGAGSIGLATARAFVAEGARVMILDLDERDLARAMAGLDGERVISRAADVTSAEQVEAALNDLMTQFGRLEQMIPLARHATAEEIARAALFLASDDSAFMTGATLAVDGGLSI